ncbi:hypothetical protein BTJ40_07795 [Microbulbifer sp. A4B17]|nr:hypothetical protein BTJ40_07795 [Microbulbifer sp. A4B17]
MQQARRSPGYLKGGDYINAWAPIKAKVSARRIRRWLYFGKSTYTFRNRDAAEGVSFKRLPEEGIKAINHPPAPVFLQR